MNDRRTERVTRVDIRIPNELYDEIQAIAVDYFNAKIHHRSNKPEVTPTILELIKIGIEHLESIPPATETVGNETVVGELKLAIAKLDSRLSEVENKLSGVNLKQGAKSYRVEEQQTEYELHEEKVLNDLELSDVLGVSNILIRDYRVKGKKPGGEYLARVLTEEWEIKGKGWVRKRK